MTNHYKTVNQTCKCGHKIDDHLEQIHGKALAGECGILNCGCSQFKENEE